MKNVVCVVDDESGHEGVYVDGEIVIQDSTVYVGELCSHIGKGPILMDHWVVKLPESMDMFPGELRDLMGFLVDEQSATT